MSNNRIRSVVATSLVLAGVLALATLFSVWGGDFVAEGANSLPAQDLSPVQGELLESPPPMYLWSYSVGCWHTGPVKRYATAGAAVEDEFGNPVVDALVEVEFDIACLRKSADSGSAYTVLNEGGYAVAQVGGSKTFVPPKDGCIITGEVVSITHPDYTWDAEGGVPTIRASLCTRY